MLIDNSISRRSRHDVSKTQTSYTERLFCVVYACSDAFNEPLRLSISLATSKSLLYKPTDLSTFQTTTCRSTAVFPPLLLYAHIHTNNIKARTYLDRSSNGISGALHRCHRHEDDKDSEPHEREGQQREGKNFAVFLGRFTLLRLVRGPPRKPPPQVQENSERHDEDVDEPSRYEEEDEPAGELKAAKKERHAMRCDAMRRNAV